MFNLRSRLANFTLIAPAALLLAVFLIWPTIVLMSKSFLDDRGAMFFYHHIFETPSYYWILLRTVANSFLTAAVCLIIGYPVAYKLTKTGKVGKILILTCILIPFWTNLLVRSYGWIELLNAQGIINSLLLYTGIIKSPLNLVYNSVGVLIGLTQIMLPYMILPLFAVIIRIDDRLIQASRSLGAGPVKTFIKVYFPLTFSGVLAGFLLIFTMTLGYFVIPALLGGPSDTMMAQLIEFNINGSLNWGMASSLSTILFTTTVLLYWIGDRWFNLGAIWGLEKK